MSKLIYKIVPAELWAKALEIGVLDGSEDDQTDGFIHFSAAEQVAETARKHFGGQDGLLLIAVNSERLGKALKWESSRGGQMFPHLYGSLPVSDVEQAVALPLAPNGVHRLPEDL